MAMLLQNKDKKKKVDLKIKPENLALWKKSGLE